MVGVRFDSALRGSEGSPTGRTDSARNWLTLPFSGELIDQRVLAYNLTLRPVFSRQDIRGLPASINSRELGVSLGARILTALPLSGTVNWEKSDGLTEGGFGTRGVTHTRGSSGILSFRNGWIPMTASFSDREARGSSRVGLNMVSIEQSYRTKSSRFTARTGKATVSYGEVRFDDRVNPSDYVTRDLRVDHMLRWGKGSRIQSGYERLDRDDRTGHMRETWRERATIAHTAFTKSTLTFEQTTSTTGPDTFRSSVVTGGMDSRIGRRVTLGVAGASRSFRHRDGKQLAWSARPHVGLGTSLPWASRFTGSASMGYQTRRNESSGADVDVLNESVRFESDGSLRLHEPGVDRATIMLRSPDETILYQEGLDYRIVEIGQITEIRVLAGGRLEPRDNALASYRFRAAPAGREDSVLMRYSAAVTGHGFTVRHSRTRRNVDEDLGDALRPVDDTDQYSTGIRTIHATAIGRLNFELERQERQSTTLSYVTHEFRAGLARSARPDVRLRLELVGKRSEEAGTLVNSAAVMPSANWRPLRALDIRGSLSFRYWKERFRRSETVWAGDVAADWRLRSVEIRLKVTHERTKFERKATGTSFNLHLVRRI